MIEAGIAMAATTIARFGSSSMRNRGVSVVYLTDPTKVSLTYERAFLQDVKSYRRDYSMT